MENAAVSTTLEERRPSLLPTALVAVAYLAVFVVFAASESWYEAFMAVHVSFVVLWVGGGLFLTVMGILAERARDGQQMAALTKMAAFAGERIFTPASIVVLSMGIAMQINAHRSFGHFWIVVGLIGFASTFAIGLGLLAPRAKKLERLIQEKGPDAPETTAAISQILLIARVDTAMLLLVVADMVIKPFS